MVPGLLLHSYSHFSTWCIHFMHNEELSMPAGFTPSTYHWSSHQWPRGCWIWVTLLIFSVLSYLIVFSSLCFCNNTHFCLSSSLSSYFLSTSSAEYSSSPASSGRNSQRLLLGALSPHLPLLPRWTHSFPWLSTASNCCYPLNVYL